MSNKQHLLNQVKTLIKIYEKHTELTGENFNIFRIMNMERDEVNTHSAIIAELLNPKGSHGLGSKPLELFIEYNIANNSDFSFDCDSALCKKELHIGKINEDKSEGGRIDIIVQDKNNEVILIENKIDAPEQENQLLRYKGKYPESKLFYLTRYGDESKAIDAPEYQIISYEEHILNWIESCAKEAFNIPMVREVLNQYSFLIRKLTNQSTNKEMEEEIQKLIKENYEESLEIYRNFEKSKRGIIDDFFNELLERSKKDKNLNQWNLVIDNGSVFDTKRFKTLLISDKENPKCFYYCRYQFINDEFLKGIVCSDESLKPHKLLETFKKSKMKLWQRSVLFENMDRLYLNKNLIIDYLYKDRENLFNTIFGIINSYIKDNKDLYDELKKHDLKESKEIEA